MRYTYFITLAIWLYSAIRPRYAAGPKTAVIAGLAVAIPCVLTYSVTGSSSVNELVIEGLVGLVVIVVATLLGAWVYKEQSQQEDRLHG